MDEALKEQLLKIIKKYNIRVKDDGLLTWDGFPDKRVLGQIKTQSDNIIKLLNEKEK